MKKRFASMAIAAALAFSTVTVVPVSAATDYKAAVAVDFHGATWENGDPGAYTSSLSVGFDKTNPSKNLTISFDAYIPAALLETEDAILEIDPSVWVGDDEQEYGNINLADNTEIDISKSGNSYEARLYHRNEETSDTVGLTTKVTGDYVAVHADAIKLGDRYTIWNDSTNEEEYAEIDESVSAYVSPSFTIYGNAITGKGTVYFDNVVVKNGDTTVNQADFNSKDVLYDTSTWSGGNKEGVAPVSFQASQKTTLTLKKSSGTVKVGKTLKINATAKPSTKITYKSSNKKIATVTSKGVVKGIKKGKATITVKAGSVTKKFKVTVK